MTPLKTEGALALGGVLALGLLCCGTACGQSQIFTAHRVCIIHADPDLTSAERGRLEVGQVAEVLGAPSGTRWIHVRKSAVEGWVYGPRGQISDDPPRAAIEMKFWFGNLHAHTSFESSEGNVDESTHEDAFAYAMDDAKGNLDFLAITPHNHLVQPGTYSKLLVTARDPRFNQPGRFVAIAGQEYSSISQGNHLNVFELDAWIDKKQVKNGRFRKLFLSFLPEHATRHTFAQFNHPYSRGFSYKGTEYGRDDFASVAEWIEATDPYVQAIEIVNTPHHSPDTDRPHVDEHTTRVDAWLWALNRGWHIAPTANQDNHRANWGSASDSRTVAIAPALTLDAIMDAFQQRRFYASEDSTMRVTFRAGAHWMGSVIDIGGFGGFTVSVKDPEEPDASYTLELFSGTIGGEVLTHTSDPTEMKVVSDGVKVHFSVEDPLPGTFHYVMVTQSLTPDDPNGTPDNAWTAPIWLSGATH